MSLNPRGHADPFKKYIEIQRSIRDESVYRIAGLILPHIGMNNPITREELARRTFSIHNDSTDRKVRLIVKKLLVEFGIPVGSVSDQAGYFIISNDEERKLVKKEFENRRDRANEVIRLLDNFDLERSPEPPQISRQMEFGL